MVDFKYWIFRFKNFSIEKKMRICLLIGFSPFLIYFFSHYLFHVYWPLYELISLSIVFFTLFLVGLIMLIKGKNPFSPDIPILAYPQGVLLVIGGMYYFIKLLIELIT